MNTRRHITCLGVALPQGLLKIMICPQWVAYIYLNRSVFSPLSVFWSRNAYSLLFVVFINLWDAPASGIVVTWRGHVSRNNVSCWPFQNKTSLSLGNGCVVGMYVSNVLFWKPVQLAVSYFGLAKQSQSTSIMSFIAHLAEQPLWHLYFVGPCKPLCLAVRVFNPSPLSLTTQKTASFTSPRS